MKNVEFFVYDRIPTKFAFQFAVKDQSVIRITGGCGNINKEYIQGTAQLFLEAFRKDFQGVILFGGTQMRMRHTPDKIRFGITEIPILISKECPESVILGIVPRVEDMKISAHGVVIADNPRDEYFTIVHPEQKACLLIQKSPDEEVIWDAEYKTCITIIRSLLSYSHADWKHVLIAYNGGKTTEKEILTWAELRWPIILIQESGGTTDIYASDETFLAQHPSVNVCEKNPTSLRNALEHAGVIENNEPPEENERKEIKELLNEKVYYAYQ